MNKVIAALSFLMLLISCCGEYVNGAYGDEKEPAKPPLHKKKVYVDEIRKNVYWPMSLPFHVRLTASPAKDAPSYLLEKVFRGPGGKKGMKKVADDTPGIQLEIQGRQFLRWYDANSGETTFLKFYSDGEPPTVTETLENAPTFNTDDTVFYGKGLTLSFAAEDIMSGVKGIFVSMDGAAFEPYGETIRPDQEKPYHVRTYAVDHVGYAGEPESLRFHVDLTAPETTHGVYTNFFGDVLSGKTVIRLSAQDPLSGVKDIFYGGLGGDEPERYTGGDISLARLPDGQYTLFYYAEDQVRNGEGRKLYSFYLDKIPPSAEITILGDHFFDGETGTDYISPRTKFALAAQDNKIGVEQILYKIDKSDESTYDKPFSLHLPTGPHSIRFLAVDKLDNKSGETEKPLKMDDIQPVSSREIKGPQFKQRNDVWITKDTFIHLSAADAESGVGGIYYRLKKDLEYLPYSKPVSIAEEGRYLFNFYGLDRVNNREKAHDGILIVDNTPPNLMKVFSLKSRGKTGEDETYPRFTTLFLGATDNSSGIAKITYKINDNKEQIYTKTIEFGEEGTFTIKIHVEDNVGNEIFETIRFAIKAL